MGKGSQRRPTQISDAENTLRWDLALGVITSEEFERKMKELEKEK